jgi:hypothetical protein
MLTYDEFDDLSGEEKFSIGQEVVAPETLVERLVEVIETLPSGHGAPVVWGEDGKPEAVVMSTAQYRDLRGDDHPPAGVVADPTVRIYTTEPLSSSRPLDLDEWAANDPFTRQLLDEIRTQERSSDGER